MKLSNEEIQRCYEELSVVVTNIHQILENVVSVKNSIEDGCWTGNASDYYVLILKHLETQVEEINSELEKTVLYLIEMLMNYNMTEEEIMKMLTSGS